MKKSRGMPRSEVFRIATVSIKGKEEGGKGKSYIDGKKATRARIVAFMAPFAQSDDEIAAAFLDRAEAYAFAWYAREGLPSEPGRYRTDDSGQWCKCLPGERGGGTWHFGMGLYRKDDSGQWRALQPDDEGYGCHADHPIGRAASILLLAHQLRLALSSGTLSAAYVMARTYRLHRLLMETDLEFGMNRALGRGLAVTRAVKKGGAGRGAALKARAIPRRAEWQKVANEYWSRHPTASKKEVASHVAKTAGGAAVSTIRQALVKPDG